jgi:hypothetical protein
LQFFPHLFILLLAMISMSTAKFIFFIAMTLGPQGPHEVFVTSSNENYHWTDQGPEGWKLKTEADAHCGWTRQQEQNGTLDDRDARAITAQTWNDGSALQLSNGNRVEKQGDAAFYIVDPGCPNQKTYTILFPKD